MEQLKMALRRMRVGVSSGKLWRYFAEAREAIALRSSSAPETKTTLSAFTPLTREITKLALREFPWSLAWNRILKVRMSERAMPPSGRAERLVWPDKTLGTGRNRVISAVNFWRRSAEAPAERAILQTVAALSLFPNFSYTSTRCSPIAGACMSSHAARIYFSAPGRSPVRNLIQPKVSQLAARLVMRPKSEGSASSGEISIVLEEREETARVE